MQAIPPENGELDLSEHKGKIIAVRGIDQGSWVYSAEVIDTGGAVEQALKAATLGSELRKLLVNYDQLSMDDIAEGLSVAFKLTASIPGVDLSSLEATTTNLIGEINKDAELKTLFNEALSKINAARANSGQ